MARPTEPVVQSRPDPVAFPHSDRFVPVGMIGYGGMGAVYRAIDRELGHEVALKVVRARRPDAIARLKSEFRARADLHHPNLVQLLNLVVTPDEAFFTMELVDAVDFLDWVWGGREDDARRRLATALVGVTSGLEALHAAGFVHFDVKPANILVDRTDRVLLADFGLSTAIRSRAGEPARALEDAGTPGFMGPERKVGGVVTPASDLFALGATIREALTGSTEDVGDRDEPLLELARRLMAPDPAARPSTTEVLATVAPLARMASVAEPATAPPFVGRRPQLASLEQALDRISPSRAIAIHIRGPSGIGKTTLVKHFLESLGAARPDALVLDGRCHPYEQLAFGGIDRVVEGLAEYLRAGAITIEGMGPRSIAALVRLFPAIPWRISQPGLRFEDPRTLRLAGIDALRELLAHAAASRPVVLWIDDLHWIDDDTKEIVEAIAGIPNTLTIYTYRDEVAPLLDSNRTDRVELELGDLGAAELEAAISAVAPQLASADCRELAVASRGYPVLARVLSRLAPTVTGTSSPAALWNHAIDQLPAEQRAMFDVLAVAPAPVAAAIATAAATIDRGSSALRALEQLGVVSRAAGRGAIRVAPFHDQLRQMRLAHLDAATRSGLHRRLADVHERTASEDYEALVHHLTELDERERAGHVAVRAADRASANLAFGTAASYYAKAIEWLPDRSEPWELHRRLAESEANRGHAEPAGRHFELAAGALQRSTGGSTHATRLSLRAAEQLLHCGRIPDGYRILRDALATVRIRLPRSHRMALLHSAVLRARLVLRGLEIPERPPPAPEEQLRLDALWMASTSLAHINYALADVLLLHHVLAALDAGDSPQLMRSLSYEAAAEITLGLRFFKQRAIELLTKAERLTNASQDEYDRGWFEVSCAATAFFCAGWTETIARAEVAERHLLQHGVGVAWERAVLHSYWLFALALTGDAVGLETRRRIALEDALARRDQLAESHCRSGYTVLAWLFRDDVAGARADRATLLGAVHWQHRERAATSRWPESSFGTPDYHALLADSHVDLYAGDTLRAHERVEEAWPFVKSALLLRIQFVGADLRFLRARCALAASHAVAHPRALRKVAMRERARLANDANPVAAPYASLLGGLLEQDPALLAAAERDFDELAMIAHAAAARYRRGELVGGREGQQVCDAARTRLLAAGVACPDKIIAMYAPLA